MLSWTVDPCLLLLLNSDSGCVSPVVPKPAEQGASQPVCGVQYRWGVFKGMYESIEKNEGGLDKFTQGTGTRFAL